MKNRKLAKALESVEVSQRHTLVTWETACSQPEIRERVPFGHCYAMAHSGGFHRVQVVNSIDDSIILEVKT